MRCPFELLGKGWLLVATLCFFLVSCSATPCRQWALDKTITSYPCYNSGRMVLEAEDDFKGIELEILREAYGTRMYVNVFSLPLPPEQDNCTIVNITIGGELKPVSAYRLQGGQRLLLPDYITQQLIMALHNEVPIHIGIGRYQADILSARFVELYEELNCIPMN